MILTISKNNPVESAKESTFKEDVRIFQDDLALTISKEYTSKQGQRNEKITTSDYNEIKGKIPSFTEKYKDKFIIENDKLVGTDELTEKEKKWAEELNISTSGTAPFDTAKWDETATAEECFLWASDEKGQDGYNVIIGYKSGLQNYPKVRIPSRCHKIICNSSYSDEYLDDSKTGRSFLNNITKIEIPETVIEIGGYAFGGSCGNALKSIKNIDIPNSVTSIGGYAFYNCSGLTNITIPNSVTSIEDDAFYGCSGLTEINVLSGNINYSSQDGILFNKDKTILIQCPIGNKLNNYSIPNSVTSIGGYAFYDCSSLTNITIPNSVTSIGGYAFYNCSSLTNITIPNSVTSIGGWAFYNCSSLTNIDFKGTMNEWNNISKDFGWEYNSRIKTITCTDGVITI